MGTPPAVGRSHDRDEIEDALTHIILSEPFTGHIGDSVFNEVQEWLKLHPDVSLQRWRESPRLYVLLRLLGYDADSELFRAFDSENITDVWLPLNAQDIACFVTLGLDRDEFRRKQFLVLARSDRLSDQLHATNPEHLNVLFGRGHFHEEDVLGQGGSAIVSRVRHKPSGKEFALKRITRAGTISDQRRQLVEFAAEVSILKRLSHKHLVSFVASYTDRESFCLILNPVAKGVLKSVLESQSHERPLPEEDIIFLRRSFGCLATALAYLHGEKVRHKDIKPGNILLNDGAVYLCDFGVSRDWSDSDHSTTTGDIIKATWRYCAPEVSDLDPRNEKSDIWSLGCVFLELITVIRGYTIEEMNRFLRAHSADGKWNNPDGVKQWFDHMKSEVTRPIDDVPFDWICEMIQPDARKRPAAVDLVQKIHNDPPYPDLFIHSCCGRADSIAPHEPSSHNPQITPIVDSPTITFPHGHDALGIQPYSPVSRSGSRSSPGQNISPSDVSVSPRSSAGYVSRENGGTTFSAFQNYRLVRRPGSLVSEHSSSKASDGVSILPASPISTFPPPSPIPAPAAFELNCHCAARPNEHHIFNATYSTVASTPPSHDVCLNCEIGEPKVQIYETRDPPKGDANIVDAQGHGRKIWWVTRRLVISQCWDRQHCSSFWIPLADLTFSVTNVEVYLGWSDCNQMKEEDSANYGKTYNWKYDPKTPNNHLTLRFNNVTDAERFAECIHLPVQDSTTILRASVDAAGTQAQIYDIAMQQRNTMTLDYRAVVITRRLLHNESKLYMIRPHLDPYIRLHERANPFDSQPTRYLRVVIDNVERPTYESDILNEPAADYTRVAKFHSARRILSSMSMDFPLGPGYDLPTPPRDVVTFLRGLTGWTLSYFTTIKRCELPKRHLGSKKYKDSDLMLWEREIEDSTGRWRTATEITIRIRDSPYDGRWISGIICAATSVSYSTSAEATITVKNKSRGTLLNITRTRMAATIPPGTNGSSGGHDRRPSETQKEKEKEKDLSTIILTFVDSRDRLEFVNLVERHKGLAASLGDKRGSTATGYGHRMSDVRRMDSLRKDFM